jgi:hypothetical protein
MYEQKVSTFKQKLFVEKSAIQIVLRRSMDFEQGYRLTRQA